MTAQDDKSNVEQNDQRTQPWKKFSGEVGKSEEDFVTVQKRTADGEEVNTKTGSEEGEEEVKADIWTV